MSPKGNQLPCFSRPLLVDSVPDDGLTLTVEAEPSECDLVAKEIGLPGVTSIKATYRVARRAHGHLQVEGDLIARITQICVVSLEPFESDISASISVVFAPQADDAPARSSSKRHGHTNKQAASPRPTTRLAPGDDEAEPPDPIVDGRIDLGVLAVEFLTLSLDFYPRKPGVRFDDVVADEADDRTRSAFAALERFKDRS